MDITTSINGYKFLTEQDAIDARTTCNIHYGIPKSPEDATQTWVDYSYADLNSPGFWYMTHNDSLTEVLGEPAQFDVVFPDPFANSL